MSFSVVIHPIKEEIFQKSDDECKEMTQILRSVNEIFIDPEFPPNSASLGILKNDEKDEKICDEPWLTPYQLSIRNGMMAPTWELWNNNPWPFHVIQGHAGDCWLLAPLMTMAKREELLKQILPEREYNMDTGMVQVRLCVNGEWRVIRIDSHLPHRDGLEKFAPVLFGNWIAFIEKAVAKIRGSYGALCGGQANCAFEYLTGCYTRTIYLNKLMDLDQLCEELIKSFSSDFLMCASTPNLDEVKDSEELNVYKQNSLCHLHQYAILDFQEYEGHRLIQIGNSNDMRWNAVFNSFTIIDKFCASTKIFWMSIEDFVRFFYETLVCEYREGWKETRIKQKIQRMTGKETQILRLHVKKRCELVVDVNVKTPKMYNIFLNFHKSSTTNNKEDSSCGELIHSAHNYGTDVTSGVVQLNPGVYTVVMAFVDENMTNVELNWVLRSPTPENFSFDFAACPFTTVLRSIQQVILQYGVADYQEADKIVIYTWKSDQSLFVMADNRRESDFFRVNGILSSPDIEKIQKSGVFNYSVPVPPMSRKIMGFFSYLRGGQFYLDANVKYKIRWQFWKFWDWFDHSVMAATYEMDGSTSLRQQ